MPFILRQVEPTYLSRGHADHLESVDDDERQVIANLTLSGAIRQLASLVHLAAHIFGQLEQDGNLIHQRTLKLKQRIHALQTKVDKHDPKTVTVPEDDLETFSEQHKENHFRSQQIEQLDKPVVLNFFTKNNRPEVIDTLYVAAAPAVTVPVIRTDFEDSDFTRLVALGATIRRRKPRIAALDIETRRPASLAQLRSWLTDDEALDEVSSTVGPDNRTVSRATSDGALHRLPSPEEKARVAAQVFSAELVPLDTSGKNFQRMTQFRRSLTHVEYETREAGGATRKRSSRRRHKKRRNTLASDDKREILLVVEHCEKLTRDKKTSSGSRSSLRQRLNLVHLFRQSVLTTPSSKRSESAVASSDLSFEEGDTVTQTETDETSRASSSATPAPPQALDATTLRPRRLGPEHTFLTGTVEVGVEVHRENPEETKRDSVYEVIPSEKEFGTLGTARPLFRGVKLRSGKDTDGARSSSGNWSGSSSTRASLDSENPSTGTNLSPPSIRHRLNRTLSNRSLDFDSALSDCSQSPAKASYHATRPLPTPTRTSIRRGWMTPEAAEGHVMSDTETSSIYSCDAEGYYTSFHIDSGLKTLKEEAVSLRVTNQSAAGSSTRSPKSTNNNTAENEYELFGKGSTSTTTSSAGTVIMREREPPSGENKKPPPEPPPRNRDSVATVIHLNFDLETNESQCATKAGEEHPDSEEPNPTAESDSDSRMETETRETEDRIRIKTTINSSRIPALCVITPPPSDDDSANSAGASALEAHIQAAFLHQISSINHSAPPPVSSIPPPESSAHPPALEAPQNGRKSTGMKNPTPRVNLTDAEPIPPLPDMPIVIKGTVVKGNKDGDLVSLAELPKTELDPQPFASGSSGESSRSSSLERRRLRQGARVTLDSDGKVVYSSDSLKRRKGAHTTFEPGQNIKSVEVVDARVPPPAAAINAEPKKDVRPSQPPPYRPAPSILRTQPDGSPSPSSPSSPGGAFVSRSDSYRQANQDLMPFQRNNSYRQANVNPPPASTRTSTSSPWGRPYTPEQKLQPLDCRSTGSGVYPRRISSPALVGGVNGTGGGIGVVAPRRVSSPALVSTLPRGVILSANTPPHRGSPGGGFAVNPNLGGGRSYGGPRVFLHQRASPLAQSGSNSSLNSTGSGFDVSSASGSLSRAGVVRPPSHPKDRPSFFASGSSSATDLRGNYPPPATTPGYDTLSPTPHLSSLPLATPGGGPSPFLRQDLRYNSLPVRFKNDSSPGRRVRFHPDQQEQTDFHQWLPRPSSANSGASATGRDSPEEGGFLDYTPTRRASPTPSSSSCSLDVSFTSSLNDPAEAKPTRSGSRLSLDQIYSALHHRFRRNSDVSTPEPTPSNTLPDTQSARQRFSWSPDSASSASSAAHPGSLLKHQTPMQDFKRKLLNYSKSPTPSGRISAVELLKPGSPSMAAASNPPASPRRSSRTNYISNRLLNRKYSSPRSDVLNSTIVEGRSEEELADSRPTPTPSAGRVTPLETTL